MKKWLGALVRGLHLAIGMTEPPPEHAWRYALVWIGVVLMFAGTFVALAFLLR